MKNKVVSYKTAMALKAKGFNEPTEFCYWGCETSLHMIAPHLTNESLGEGKCSAPTMDEVRQWLADNHTIYIDTPLKKKTSINRNSLQKEEYCYTYGYLKYGDGYFEGTMEFQDWNDALQWAINIIIDNEI